MKQRMVMIILIALVVMGGGYYAYNELVPEKTQETSGPVYSTKEVTKGDIDVGVETTGMLNPTNGGGIRVPGERSYGGAPVSYILEEIILEEGAEVKKGDLIARLSSSDLEIKIEEAELKLKNKKDELEDLTGLDYNEAAYINPSEGITVRAPIAGRITNLEVEEGTDLQLGKVICRIVDDSRFKIRAKLYSSEAKKVSKGDKVKLRFGMFDEFHEGTVTDVSPNAAPDVGEDGKASGFVYWMWVEGDNPGLIQPGMEVQIGIAEEGINVHWFANSAKVDSYIEEKKVINRAEAIVTDVYVHDMEIVEKGDMIISMAGDDVQEDIQEILDEISELRIDMTQLKSKLDQLDITASMDGVISNIHEEEGASVMAGQWIGDIYNTSEMMLWTQVDDIDIVNVKQDAPVKVTVDAIADQSFTGKVTHISPSGQQVNGITQFMVNIEIEGGPQLRPGMQANAFIDAGSAKDVLLVPIEGIFEEDGKSMVEVLKEDGTVEMLSIKVGLMNYRYAEVSEGLQEGDMVITGSSADILPSEHIQSKDPIMPDSGNDGGGTEEKPQQTNN